ncbi:MAG: PEP-CTERM sorting domain-containing protein [Opitutales bacterium]
MKLKTRLLAILVTALPSSALAQLLLTGSLTETEISFTLSGTVPSGITEPAQDFGLIYIGVPGDNDWIDQSIGVSTGSKSFDGTIDGWNVSDVLAVTSSSADYVAFSSGQHFDFTDGGSASATLLISANNPVFHPENVVMEDLIATWGFSGSLPFPNSTTQIGAFSAVPEPSTYGAIAGGLMFLGTVYLRSRRRPDTAA